MMTLEWDGPDGLGVNCQIVSFTLYRGQLRYCIAGSTVNYAVNVERLVVDGRPVVVLREGDGPATDDTSTDGTVAFAPPILDKEWKRVTDETIAHLLRDKDALQRDLDATRADRELKDIDAVLAEARSHAKRVTLWCERARAELARYFAYSIDELFVQVWPELSSGPVPHVKYAVRLAPTDPWHLTFKWMTDNDNEWWSAGVDGVAGPYDARSPDLALARLRKTYHDRAIAVPPVLLRLLEE